MSTITDAIKKRKKEGGEEEAEELVPMSLDEPDVDVPKDRSFRRIASLAAIVLLVGAVGGSAVMLYRGTLGRRSAGGKADKPVRTASLTQPERQEVLPAEEAHEAPPLPERTSPPMSKPAGTEPEKDEAPSPLAEVNGAAARAEAKAAREDMSPSPVREEPQVPAPESPSPPAAKSPPAVSPTPPPPKERAIVPEAPATPETDPFAGIKLQGIMYFAPGTPAVIINGRALKVGDSLKGIEVVEIGADSVKLRYRNIERTIRY